MPAFCSWRCNNACKVPSASPMNRVMGVLLLMSSSFFIWFELTGQLAQSVIQQTRSLSLGPPDTAT